MILKSRICQKEVARPYFCISERTSIVPYDNFSQMHIRRNMICICIAYKMYKNFTMQIKCIEIIKSEEFRPINMLPVYEKAMESVVKDQLSAFIDQNNILI
jgi:hypothetical protein